MTGNVRTKSPEYLLFVSQMFEKYLVSLPTTEYQIEQGSHK